MTGWDLTGLMGIAVSLFFTTAIIDDTVAHTTACLIHMSFNQQQNEFWWMTKVENHWSDQSGGNASLPSRNKSNFGRNWWEHWHPMDVRLEAWNYVSPPSSTVQTWGNLGEIFRIDLKAARALWESRRGCDSNGFGNLLVVVIQTCAYAICPAVFTPRLYKTPFTRFSFFKTSQLET